MLQLLLFGCIVFPFLAALLALFGKNGRSLRLAVFAGAGVPALSAVLLAAGGGFVLPGAGDGALGKLISVLDFFLLLYLIRLAWQARSRLAVGLGAAQLAGVLFLGLVLPDTAPAAALLADSLSLTMVLVISLVGGVICIYGLGYMKDHEEHLHLARTRQPRFFFVLLLLLGAMNGLVLSDDLGWMFFFWEITTMSSFLLIGHDGTDEAKANALRALWMNMVGGVAFVIGMIFLAKSAGTLSVQAVLAAGDLIPLLPPAFLCLAGFTKAAQIPFQSWLCGAMVAPTPVSALLHSSTMVKAGVYLVLRLAPSYAGTMLAGVVALSGAFTFAAASALACGQSNGKKILAYSTIANLGLIIACAGIGTSAAVTAAVLLIIFHAVSKALLFLCVGAVEQKIGSRNIEDMRGLYQVMPRTAVIMVVGIATMMLPPFGALLAKWMAVEAAAVSTAFMPVLVVLIALGSALTVLFWARWAGLVLGVNPLAARPVPEEQHGTMRFALRSLAGGALVLSLLVPCIYAGLEADIARSFGIEGLFTEKFGSFYNGVGLFCVYPIYALLAAGVWYALRETRRSRDERAALPYLSGIQSVDDGVVGFNGPLNAFTAPKFSNYYLEDWFGEARLTGKLNTVALVLMAIMLGGLL